MIDTGHWTHQLGLFDPSDYFGFVYKITNTDGEYYIGQKRFHNKIRRKPLKGKKRVRLDTKPSDWKVYNSSGKFKELIETNGPHGYTFSIIALCKNANELNVFEIEHIIKHGRDSQCVNEFICRGASYKNLKG